MRCKQPVERILSRWTKFVRPSFERHSHGIIKYRKTIRPYQVWPDHDASEEPASGKRISLCCMKTFIQSDSEVPPARQARFWTCPGQSHSGESDPQRHISKTGDSCLCSLLVQSVQCIVGRFGRDVALRWALKLDSSRGKAEQQTSHRGRRPQTGTDAAIACDAAASVSNRSRTGDGTNRSLAALLLRLSVQAQEAIQLAQKVGQICRARRNGEVGAPCGRSARSKPGGRSKAAQ